MIWFIPLFLIAIGFIVHHFLCKKKTSMDVTQYIDLVYKETDDK